ncbi:MAG: hypothetical protein RL701_4754 [Pseudomonadota bacterium]
MVERKGLGHPDSVCDARACIKLSTAQPGCRRIYWTIELTKWKTMHAGIQSLWGRDARARGTCALICLTLYAALVGFNCIVQLSFVPALARDYKPLCMRRLLAAFSMAHPGSLSWTLEMWGYAALGIATWLVAPFFAGGGVERVARFSFAANGPISLLGALLSVVRPGWEGSRDGLIAFAVWNGLTLVMSASAGIVFAWRLHGHGGRHALSMATVDDPSQAS